MLDRQGEGWVLEGPVMCVNDGGTVGPLAPPGACHLSEKVNRQTRPADYAALEPSFNIMTLHSGVVESTTVTFDYIRVLNQSGAVMHEYSYDNPETARNVGLWTRVPACRPDPPAGHPGVVQRGMLTVAVRPAHQAHGYGGYIDTRGTGVLDGRFSAVSGVTYSVEALVRIDGPGAVQLGLDFWRTVAGGYSVDLKDPVNCANFSNSVCEGGYSNKLVGPTAG